MSRTIYVTHCCSEKVDPATSRSDLAVDELHVGPKFQSFVSQCLRKKVEWAVLCDGYGVWLPDERHPWYDKHPTALSAEERLMYALQFAYKLPANADIVFYGNLKSPRFSPVHREIMNMAQTHVGARWREVSYYEDIR